MGRREKGRRIVSCPLSGLCVDTCFLIICGSEDSVPSPQRGRGVRGEGEPCRDKSSSQQTSNSPLLTSRAGKLRHSDTLAEKLTWKLLRGRQVLHYKFRRQVPLGNAIMDFCCSSLELIIEPDGARHACAFRSKKDQRREEELPSRDTGCCHFLTGLQSLRIGSGSTLTIWRSFG